MRGRVLNGRVVAPQISRRNSNAARILFSSSNSIITRAIIRFQTFFDCGPFVGS